MEYGKKLPYCFSNYQRGQQVNCCSPMVFSNVFNDEYFLSNSLERFDMTKGSGLSFCEENILLYEYGKSNARNGVMNNSGLLQLYPIVETNAKFRIPLTILREIFTDKPERGLCYLYIVTYCTEMFGYHRVGLIRDRENFYLIDAANTVVYVMTEDEFHCGIIINNITNLSVLFSIEDKNFLGGTDGFETKTFQHLM